MRGPTPGTVCNKVTGCSQCAYAVFDLGGAVDDLLAVVDQSAFLTDLFDGDIYFGEVAAVIHYRQAVGVVLVAFVGVVGPFP